MNSHIKRPSEAQAQSMTSDEEKRFPLPENNPARQDEPRALLGLFKWEPLETREQFAERIVRESNLAMARLQEQQEQRSKSRGGVATKNAYTEGRREALGPEPREVPTPRGDAKLALQAGPEIRKAIPVHSTRAGAKRQNSALTE